MSKGIEGRPVDFETRLTGAEARDLSRAAGVDTCEIARWCERKGSGPPVEGGARVDPLLQEHAAMYRWLRAQFWDSSPLCVVANPKDAVKLGRDCPSGERLDQMIREAMGAQPNSAQVDRPGRTLSSTLVATSGTP